MKDSIKRAIVQLRGTKFIGSGVILQSNKKNLYVLTAKHNFAYGDDDKEYVEKIKLDNLQYDIKCNKIKILHPYSILKVSDILLLDNPKIDFAILKIENNNEQIDSISSIKIFNDDFKECVIAGYPEIRVDNSIGYFDCRYETRVDKDEDQDDYENTFEVYSKKRLDTHSTEEMNTIRGISGGGVFVEGSDGKIYLAGIEIEYKPIANLVCISLRDIIDKINQKLKEKFDDKIEVGGFSLYEKFGIDIEKLNLRDIKSEISRKNDYINNLFENKKGEIDEFIFLQNPRNEYYKEINQKYKNIENLAKAFLYNGIVLHDKQDYNRATRQFKKAVKLDPNLEVYFAQSKFQREKGLSTKQEKNIANVSSNNEKQLIENLIESIKKKEELESNILHLNHLLYKKIDLFPFKWSVKNLIERVTKLDFKQIFISTKIDIIKYTKKLSDFYLELEQKDFQNAQRQLKGLQYTFQLFDDFEINKKLLDIYEESQNDFFGNSCIDKKALLKELWDLMDRFEPNSDEYLRVKDMIQNNLIVDKNYSEFLGKIKQFEENYDNQIDSLSLGLKQISQNVVDKDVLMQIDFMLKNLTTSNNGLNLKINNIRLENKKFNQQILSTFKMIIQRGNRELEESIQKVSNQNSIETRLMLNQLLRRFERGLDNLEIKQDGVDFSRFNDELKNIVADEVNKFYTKIDNSEEIIKEKDKIIRLIQKRYGEHIFSLKRSLNDKNQELGRLQNKLKELKQGIDEIQKQCDFKEIKSIEVKEELLDLKKEYENLEQNIEEDSKINLTEKEKIVFQNKIDKLQSKIAELNTQLTLKEKDMELIKSKFKEEIAMLNSWILALESEYKESKQQSQEVSEKFGELSDEKAKLEEELERFSTFDETKKNDIKLLIDNHKREINELENLIEQWKGKTEQLSDLEESIKLSSEIATTLVNLEKNYEEKIKIIEARFKKIKHNPKNEMRLREIFNEIIKFEKTLDEVKRKGDVYPIKADPNITLHLLETDLERIDEIIRKRQSKLYVSYCMTRNILIGVIAISTLLLYEPFWEIYKRLLDFLGLI